MEIFDGMGQAADVIGGKWAVRLTLEKGKVERNGEEKKEK